MPAIDRGIFRFLAQLDNLAQQRTCRGIALLEFATNPCQTIPAPHGAIVRLAKAIDAAG